MNVPFTVSQGKVVVVMNAVINTTTIAISNELSMLLWLYKQWWWDNMANLAARYCCKLSWNVYLLYWLQFPVLPFSMSGGCVTLLNWWTEVTVKSIVVLLLILWMIYPVIETNGYIYILTIIICTHDGTRDTSIVGLQNN